MLLLLKDNDAQYIHDKIKRGKDKAGKLLETARKKGKLSGAQKKQWNVRRKRGRKRKSVLLGNSEKVGSSINLEKHWGR